jgi:hypothetical protein
VFALQRLRVMGAKTVGEGGSFSVRKKVLEREEQQQRQTQIPFGNDKTEEKRFLAGG